MNVIVILQGDKIVRFAGEELAVCSRMRVCVTGQHGRRVKYLAGQVTILAGHCPLTDRHFEP